MQRTARQACAAPPATVWELWRLPSHWPRWDSAVAGVSPEVPLASRQRYAIRSTSGSRTRIRVLRVEAGRSYVEQAKLPLARLRVTRQVLPVDGGGSELTAIVDIGGLLGGLWSLLLGARVAGSVSASLTACAWAAEAAPDAPGQVG